MQAVFSCKTAVSGAFSLGCRAPSGILEIFFPAPRPVPGGFVLVCSVPVYSVLVARCEPVCSGGTSLSSPEHSSELYFSGLLGPVFQKYISLLFLPQAGDVLFVIQRDFTRAFPEKTTLTEKEYILTVPLRYRQDVFFYSSPIENGKVHLRTVSPGHMS